MDKVAAKGVAVLLCETLKSQRFGLDLEEIKRWLEDRVHGASVAIEPGPCCKPAGSLNLALSGASRLILGLCSRDYSRSEIEAQARKARIDPFGIEWVHLGAYCAQVLPGHAATEKAKLLLVAASAKAAAYSESLPENAKPILSLDQQVSRRALFTLPPIRYEAVPSVREEMCAARYGCRVCVSTCPWQALAPGDSGSMGVNKTRCTGCGACVSVCPRSAVDMPGTSLEQIHAQVASFLDNKSAGIHPRAILFVCAKAASALEELARKGLFYPAGWLPVEVPCAGIVTPTWLLQSLNLGAAVVAVLPCQRDDCRFGQPTVVGDRVQYSREVLKLLGGFPEQVRLLDPGDEKGLIGSLNDLPDGGRKESRGFSLAPSAFAMTGAAEAILGLADTYGTPLDRSLDHPHSPLGHVEFRDGCTGCGVCSGSCPTGALSLDRDSDTLSLTFNPRLCIGCRNCVPVCPEKVIEIRRTTNLGRLSGGRIVLYRGSEARCEKCGGLIAPQDMLRKISALLGDDASVSEITRYCPSCRGTLFSEWSS
jgi:ferredoxin/coenzyme F420-reducing hydrogenase delta subunit